MNGAKITNIAAMRADGGRMSWRASTTKSRWAAVNPLEIANGKMKISDAPGLGVTLDEDWLTGHRFAGEPYWN